MRRVDSSFFGWGDRVPPCSRCYLQGSKQAVSHYLTGLHKLSKEVSCPFTPNLLKFPLIGWHPLFRALAHPVQVPVDTVGMPACTKVILEEDNSLFESLSFG